MRGQDAQITAVLALIAQAAPDIIALQGIDFDAEMRALTALRDALAARGHDMPHAYALPSNAGLASGLDLNGNGRLGDADDNHGYGRFTGAGAMALLSRHPIDRDAVQDFTPMLWRDLPGHLYPTDGNTPFAGTRAFAAHRLSSKGHWSVPVDTPQGPVTLWTWHATPPVFDGPEDRNGRRNHDEAAFWLSRLGTTDAPLVLLGTANIDPDRGEGRPAAITSLLTHPRLQDAHGPAPTADFRDPSPGDLRVDYLLPSTHWRITDHGRLTDPEASRHDLLWVDLEPADP
ncbi:endonuclease/exonuclease/phosphatase family protein [Sulfitobacter albidus]|uniref:endonuclease/exonuclease/phosphatase family protein n=1 Tax=Sulfitobacter albidus TaxID=2829501 RepID=UPI0020C8854E|nr:endonuclease/exonuclease/phosphatase family protein [Sulfitobacter albidus]